MSNAEGSGLFNVADLKQQEADMKLLKLVEKQKQEKEEALKKLEMRLASKQSIELEIEQLKGKLEVMKHMAEEDTNLEEELDKMLESIELLEGKLEVMKHMADEDIILEEELDKMRKTLEEKNEKMEDIDSYNHTLIKMQQRANDELEEAKKEIISRTGGQSQVGVKRIGELDRKAFLAACKEKTGKDEEEEFALQYFKWEDKIRDPNWHPFKVINDDGQAKRKLLEGDVALQTLKAELGEKAHDVVVKALLEINEFNPSGGFPVRELWNFKEDRKASMAEVAGYLVKQWKIARRARHTTPDD